MQYMQYSAILLVTPTDIFPESNHSNISRIELHVSGPDNTHPQCLIQIINPGVCRCNFEYVIAKRIWIMYCEILSIFSESHTGKCNRTSLMSPNQVRVWLGAVSQQSITRTNVSWHQMASPELNELATTNRWIQWRITIDLFITGQRNHLTTMRDNGAGRFVLIGNMHNVSLRQMLVLYISFGLSCCGDDNLTTLRCR